MTEKAVLIRSCKPGELSYISYLHCRIYEREYGFDSTFEHYLLDAMAQYLKDSGARGHVWVVEESGQVGGSIAVVETDPETVQLRWFLLAPELRSRGLGKRLMETALEHCRIKGYGKAFLWTVARLEAARHLYEKYGFRKVEQVGHDIWGQKLVEERWELDLR